MRIRLTFALIAAAIGSAAAVAGPASMMQAMNEACATPAEPESKGGWGWAKKWFGGDANQQPNATAPRYAYVPNQSAQQGAFTARAGAAGESIYGAATPNTATYAPRPQLPSLAGVAPAFTTPEAPAAHPVAAFPPVAEPPSTPTLAQQQTPQPPSTSKQLRERGHALDRAGELVAAEGLYRQAIGADPTDPAALNDLGICLARQRKLEASAAMLRQAIAIRPDKALYRNNLATVLVELGETDEAFSNLETVSRAAVAHFNLGQLLTRAGKTEQAITQLQKAVSLEPGLVAAEQALAKLAPATEAPKPATPRFVATAPSTPTLAAQTPVLPPERVATPTLAAPTAPAMYPAAAPFRSAQLAVTPSAQPRPVEAVEPVGVPSFPRLLPPVLDR